MALKHVARVTIALASLLAGCAVPILPADSIDAVRTPRADVVDIVISQDAQHRLVVRYRAPAAVTHLDFLLHDDRMDSAFRTPFMKPANDCGALVPGGLTLRHGTGCEEGAIFVVAPRAMELDAMYEPAQPSSDGGVLLYTGYYAAAAPDLAIRWRFTPAAGDYGIDDSRRRDAAWTVETGHVYDGARTPADQRDDEEWLTAQHAQHYVYLGHSPITQSGGVLWVRDPAVPQSIVDTVGRAGPLAWDAYASAAARQPAGQTAVVVLGLPAGGGFGYHGDRTEGRMLRLSFALSDTHDAASASKFVAHEVAHLWNHGVFRSDMARPWLHEGDAEWAALNAMRDAGLLSDEAFVDELQARIDNCITVRGEHAAATLKPGRAGDDPYGCGVALQLLGFARVHAAHADASPLAVWGALHRAQPTLEAAGFARFFDGDGAPMLQRLLLDGGTPFASTYRADLAVYLPLRDGAAEPAPGPGRRQLAANLMAALQQADCGRLGFSTHTHGDQGEFVLDDDLACKSLPSGAHVVTLAGVPVLTLPRAAWRAVQHACAAGGRVEAGLAGRAPVTQACPMTLPDLPPQVALPDDVLVRLGLAHSHS